jgi:hypothetical protein
LLHNLNASLPGSAIFDMGALVPGGQLREFAANAAIRRDSAV